MKNHYKRLSSWRRKAAVLAASTAMAVLSIASPLPVQAKAGADYREWKQKDPEFNKEPAWPISLTGTQDYYLGQYGCLVTSISMLLRHYDIKPDSDTGFNPFVCSSELLSAGLFDRLCNLYTEKVGQAYPAFRFKGRTAYSPEKLAELYNQGYACIAAVLNYGHYIAIDDGSVPGAATIFDPDSDYRFLDQYDKVNAILYFEMTDAKRPDFSPIGELTGISVDDHKISLNGYVFDRDASSVAVDIYVNDQKVETVKTTEENKAVTDKFKTTSTPGFRADFTVDEKLNGWQPVRLVAHNTGRQGDVFNTTIAEDRVYVGEDITAPTISNGSVFRRGAILEISANVADDKDLSVASLVTWKDDRSLDDFTTFELFSNPLPVKDGKISTAFIPDSEGEWKTAIAARDSAGNVTIKQIGKSSYSKEDTTHTIYRLYNPNSGEHFYTPNTTERNDLIKAGWNDEGIGWVSPGFSGDPVYRLYNPNAGDHHYTMSLGEKNALVDLGWNDEGIGWLSDSSKSVPIYRQYNPNAKAGSHNYTPSFGEHNALGDLGWHLEGTAWYATSASGR